MYSPVHATAGLLLAQVMPDPITAFFVGMASHYVLDAIPHGDTHLGSWLTGGHAKRRIAVVESLDLGLAAITILSLLTHHPQQTWLKLVAGAVGGITPDLLWGLRFILDSQHIRIPVITPLLHRHDRLHTWGHAKHRYDINFAVGVLAQGLLVLLALFYL